MRKIHANYDPKPAAIEMAQTAYSRTAYKARRSDAAAMRHYGSPEVYQSYEHHNL